MSSLISRWRLRKGQFRRRKRGSDDNSGPTSTSAEPRAVSRTTPAISKLLSSLNPSSILPYSHLLTHSRSKRRDDAQSLPSPTENAAPELTLSDPTGQLTHNSSDNDLPSTHHVPGASTTAESIEETVASTSLLIAGLLEHQEETDERLKRIEAFCNDFQSFVQDFQQHPEHFCPDYSGKSAIFEKAGEFTTGVESDEMNSIQPKQQPVDVENWDDDEDFQVDGPLHIRATSNATSISSQALQHRNSNASRQSMRSDVGSSVADEDTRPEFTGEFTPHNAIASVIKAGIPISPNTPPSALLGGTIKRLGTTKPRKIIDDWTDDLDVGNLQDKLTIKASAGAAFPEDLEPTIEESSFSPAQSETKSFAERMSSIPSKPVNPDLAAYFDNGDPDDPFDESHIQTIKPKKNNTRGVIPPLSHPQFPIKPDVTDDFEADLDIPEDGQIKLNLPTHLSQSPAPSHDDFDNLTEASLGTRSGGAKRERHSTRSSSSCAISPSITGSYIAESEDDHFEMLDLPPGPLDFNKMLGNRQHITSPDAETAAGEQPDEAEVDEENFFSGLDIRNNDILGSSGRARNQNVKHTITRVEKPAQTAMVTANFTQKAPTTRLPRPRSGHDRSSGSRLEPVAESSDAATHPPRPQSRFDSTAGNSPSAIPVPTSLSVQITPSTPNRRQRVTTRTSMKNLRTDATTSSAQLLNSKKSLPNIRNTSNNSSRGNNTLHRPSSRQDLGARPSVPFRPKTPLSRADAGSSQSSARKPTQPFLPAGIPAGSSQSHHVDAKATRDLRKPNSGTSNSIADARSTSRTATSRRTMRSPSPKRKDAFPASLARIAASKQQMFRPNNRKNYGNGKELDGFDDLPTSAANESKFTRLPDGTGAPKSLTKKNGAYIPPRSTTPGPSSINPPSTPSRLTGTPNFARDTNASRMAREQRIGSASASTGTLSRPPAPNRGPPNASPSANRSKRYPGRNGKPRQPQLIKPLGDSHQTPKSLKGMYWNPATLSWEGNDTALASFDTPSQRTQSASPVRPTTTQSPAPAVTKGPALIQNKGPSSSVQAHGRMVYDGATQRWIKVPAAKRQNAANGSTPLSPVGGASEVDSDDPFAGLDDLEDDKGMANGEGGSKKINPNDEWLVGEEFDVGPEFIRKQRDEEVVWRKNVDPWVRTEEELRADNGGRPDARQLALEGFFDDIIGEM